MQHGVRGPVLNLFMQIYSKTVSTVWVNGLLSPEFAGENALKQGDNLSPTAFCQFINGLLKELKLSGKGVKISSSELLCTLAYADDIVLIAKTETDLQVLLNIVTDWCN